MRKAIKRAAISASLLGMFAAPAMAATNQVTVIRGNAVQTATGQPGAKAPAVVRGWEAGAERVQFESETAPGTPDWIAVGGDSLWFVERDGGRVIGCWMQESTQVGEIDIRCGEAPQH